MSADDLQYEFVEAGGMRFEVATAGDPASKQLALLLHGFPECAFSWRHQLHFLAERGYRVWAPNQRGYGNSPMPRGAASYRVEELVSDVANLIDAWKASIGAEVQPPSGPDAPRPLFDSARHGLAARGEAPLSGAESVHLAGHDWGAMVAWEFAIRRVRPLTRLAIFNVPHPAIFREQIRNNKEQRRRSRYVAFFQLPWLPEYMLRRKNAALIESAFRGMAIDKSRFGDDVIAVYRANALRPGGATAMINWYRAAGRSFGAEVETPAIETPTLMVWGEEDSALGKELTYGTERYVKDLTLRYLPQVSHWVQQEAPERVNEIWGAWLDGRDVPGNTR